MKSIFNIRNLLIAGLVCGGVARASADTETLTESYAISSDGIVTVKNVNGRITIKAWDRDDIQLEAEKSANSREGLEGIQVKIESTGDLLEVTTELPRKKGWFGRSKNYGAKVNYTLQVPASIRLKKIQSVNGSVSITGVRGGVDASTVNGSINALKLDRSVVLETVNGGITCEAFTTSRNDHVRLKTVNGSVDLKLARAVDGNLDVKTVNGSIKSDLVFTRAEVSGRKKLRAQLGDGGVAIEVETVNGGVRLHEVERVSASAN